MKTTILCSIAVSILLLIFAAIIAMGRGDRMINNYRHLTDEQKARINVRRMRITTAVMLVFVAVLIPCNVLAKTDAQHLILVVVTAVGIVGFMLVLRFWAGVPIARKSIRK